MYQVMFVFNDLTLFAHAQQEVSVIFGRISGSKSSFGIFITDDPSGLDDLEQLRSRFQTIILIADNPQTVPENVFVCTIHDLYKVFVRIGL